MNRKIAAVAAAVAIAAISTGCTVSVPTSRTSEAASSPSATEATFPYVGGLTLRAATNKIRASGLNGQINVHYEGDEFGNPVQTPDDWHVVSSSPAGGFSIGGSASIKLSVVNKDAPAQNTLIFESAGDLWEAVIASGVVCRVETEPIKAVQPDFGKVCSDDLLAFGWKLDSNFSKTKFRNQANFYADNQTPGNEALIGQNWIMYGPSEKILKIQKVNGGSLIRKAKS